MTAIAKRASDANVTAIAKRASDANATSIAKTESGVSATAIANVTASDANVTASGVNVTAIAKRVSDANVTASGVNVTVIAKTATGVNVTATGVRETVSAKSVVQNRNGQTMRTSPSFGNVSQRLGLRLPSWRNPVSAKRPLNWNDALPDRFRNSSSGPRAVEVSRNAKRLMANAVSASVRSD